MINIIIVDKREKEAISAKYPEVHFAMTCKQKSKARRHKYYMAEEKDAVRLLRAIRKGSYVIYDKKQKSKKRPAINA